MPSTLDLEMVATAVELINEYGGNVHFDYQNRDQVYNEADGTYSAGTPIAPADVKAVIEDKGTWIEGAVQGEKKVTVAAEDFVKPEAGDKFTIVGEQFTVMRKGVFTTYSGETPVIYEVYGVK